MLSKKTVRLLLAARCGLHFNSRAASKLYKIKQHSLTKPANFCKVDNYFAKNDNPANHTSDDLGLMYTIPANDYKRMAMKDENTGIFTSQFQSQAKCLNEASMVIREPGLELISYLKNADYSDPVIRYLIHGPRGSGKSMVLAYAIHYCMSQGWLILPNMSLWMWGNYISRYKPTQKQEIMESNWNKERVDIPQRAVTWLSIFRAVNEPLLKDIKTSQKYVWSKHETADVGTTFSSLIDFGQARVRVATDVIGAIMKEIRLQDESTMPRTLVAVDGVNSIFHRTKLSVRHNQQLHMYHLSYVHSLSKLLQSTWSNGAIVAAFHSNTLLKKPRKGYVLPGSHPYDLLGPKGFDWLDPHVPIEVDCFTDKQVLSQLAYYKDKKWLTGNCLSEAGEAEIMQLSYNNPADLAQICLSAY